MLVEGFALFCMFNVTFTAAKYHRAVIPTRKKRDANIISVGMAGTSDRRLEHRRLLSVFFCTSGSFIVNFRRTKMFNSAP